MDATAMKTWLEVPFEDKDLVKRLGAQYDSAVRRWWIPNTASRELFRKWVPERITYSEWINAKCNEATAFWERNGNPAMGEALCIFWRSDSSKVISDRDDVDIHVARHHMSREMHEVFESAGEKVIELFSTPVENPQPAWL